MSLKHNVLDLPLGSGIGSAICILVTSLSSVRAARGKRPATSLPFLEVNMSTASVPVKLFFRHVIDTTQPPYGAEIRFLGDGHQRPHPDETVDMMNEFVTGKNVYHECTAECIEAFKSLWRLRPAFAEALREMVHVDVCFNFRRGDKVTLEPHLKCHAVQEYVDEVDRQFAAREGTGPSHVKMWHTSDDYVTYEELCAARPAWSVGTFCTPQDTGYFLAELNASGAASPHVLAHVVKFVHELFVMQKSELFVGTASTSVAFLAKLLRASFADADKTRFEPHTVML